MGDGETAACWRERDQPERETRETSKDSRNCSVARHGTGGTRRGAEVKMSRMSENGEKQGGRQVREMEKEKGNFVDCIE